MKTTQLICLCSLILAGCGKKPTEIADKAGESVGENLTEFSRSIGKGVDKQLMVSVVLNADAMALGLSHTTAKKSDMATNKKGVTIYFVASKDIDATVKAFAFNADGAEIGRSKLPVKLAKDDAAYFTFEFPDEMDSMTVKEYHIGL